MFLRDSQMIRIMLAFRGFSLAFPWKLTEEKVVKVLSCHIPWQLVSDNKTSPRASTLCDSNGTSLKSKHQKGFSSVRFVDFSCFVRIFPDALEIKSRNTRKWCNNSSEICSTFTKRIQSELPISTVDYLLSLNVHQNVVVMISFRHLSVNVIWLQIGDKNKSSFIFNKNSVHNAIKRRLENWINSK